MEMAFIGFWLPPLFVQFIKHKYFPDGDDQGETSVDQEEG
jgi:hypothetical protein